MMDTNGLYDYVSKEVVNMLEFLKHEGNTLKDYKISGNDRGTTIVLRYSQEASMAINTPVVGSSPKHRSTAARRRSSRRQNNSNAASMNMVDTERIMELSAVPFSNTSRGEEIEHKQYGCKQTLTTSENEPTKQNVKDESKITCNEEYDNGGEQSVIAENEVDEEHDSDISNKLSDIESDESEDPCTGVAD